MPTHRKCLAILFALAACCVAHVAIGAEPSLTFERDVRPILKKHCFQCHGEEEELQGKLDLRLVRLMTTGGESGPAFTSGKGADSLLIQRIEQGEMPPEGKKVTAAELAILRQWIDEGAKTARPEPAQLSEITDEERAFWSFQPIRDTALPSVTNAAIAQSPIDLFLLKELENKNLSFSPVADKAVLARRAWFTLLGLPPTAADIEAFVNDPAPDAWERLLDGLLASPHYGERWARHWLDVAGYADSDGFSEKDFERRYAYKYRDYVISSINVDKPWKDFIVEQLAGDELHKPPYASLTPQEAQQLIATGFLRMGPDGTGDTALDQVVARNAVLDDTIKIVSTSLLGLTVGCAQCHNHRYDPIPQTDYYQIRAIFEPAYDVKAWKTPGARQISLLTAAERQRVKDLDAAISHFNQERAAEVDKLVASAIQKKLDELQEEERALARAALDTPVKSRTDEQKKLLARHPSLNVNVKNLAQFEKAPLDAINKKYADETAKLNKKKPTENEAAVLTEVPGKVPATHVFFRGDVHSPRAQVQPAELTVLLRDEVSPLAKIPVDDPKVATTGRRLAYAKWLASGEHPLVARVLVNRFWLHQFGRGIVATPGDFGLLGARPTHAELLDWLATRFTRDGWELKRLQRLVLSSTAFQQSSVRTDELDAVDPDNQLLGRMHLRRLESETVRDAMLKVSGRLTTKLHGKPVPVTPDEIGQVIVGVDTRDGAGRFTGRAVPLGEEEFRRSLYVQVRRSLPLSMLETFDSPLLTPNCEVRNQSTAAPQSLLMMNNRFVLNQASYLAKKIQADAKGDLSAQIDAAWQAIYAVRPDSEQLTMAREFLVAQAAEFEQAVKPAADDQAKEPPSAEVRALANLCQALLGSNAFLYVD
ncbi:Planctomycete cytochrome C [Anatilimnocola aggregata]|uniref:Planctomycete cytochrome C n=1 Tax=Anatilimnocola aggregata TaxID=2528021 RepID=A0A517YAM6_9BACT|nr:PSD1 and planctomycete cytochrome C domain-containing protein [Anatilimnocola aggregata]QDU27287.1 Planctomycete cytochrome C [Anatilimnocola aggregata]